MLKKTAKLIQKKIIRPLDIGIYQKIVNQIDVRKSDKIDISGCKSVCLVLGPYRNLTTLTASTMFLHPNCQVLNHGGRRIFSRQDMDFISDYSREKFNRFLKFAIQISAAGRKGDSGGSILKSHAFDKSKYDMTDIASAVKPLKDNIQCLFWKESLKTSNLIRAKNINLTALFDQEPRLRFILPIRNPIDCAQSNLRTGHVNRFMGIDGEPTLKKVLDQVLGEILFYGNMRQQNPDRFFHYYEHTISREMLTELGKFLYLDPTEEWIQVALAAMEIKNGYEHDQDIIDYYQHRVEESFEHLPHLKAGLLAFKDV